MIQQHTQLEEKRGLRDKPEGEQGGAGKEGRARRGEQGEASKEGCCDTATYTTGGKRELRDKPEGEQGGAGKEGCCDTATYTTGGKRELRDKQGGADKEGRTRRVAVIQQHTQLEQKDRLNKAGKRDL